MAAYHKFWRTYKGIDLIKQPGASNKNAIESTVFKLCIF